MPCIIFLVILILIVVFIKFALPILGVTAIFGISLLNMASAPPTQPSLPLAQYSQNGIQFSYPSDTSISENLENIRSDYRNLIFVKRQTISDLVNTCENSRGDAYSIKAEYEKAFANFQKSGDIAEIKVVDNIGCAWTAGNIYSEKTKTETNGVFFHNIQTNGCLTIDTFYSQVMLFIDENEVATITYNYKAHPALKTTIRKYTSDGCENEPLADEVLDYFKFGKPIKTNSIKNFETAELQFRDIINSIDITD